MSGSLPAPRLSARGFENPARDPLRNGGSVDDRHEFCGRDEATGWVVPANKCFRTDQAAVRQTDLWLIEQFEFFSPGGAYQFGLKCQSCLKFLSDAALEQHVAAAPGCLGATKRQMAVAQQFVSRHAAAWIDGYSDADLDTVQTRSSQKRRLERERETFAQLRDGFGHANARDRYGKFIAAQPCDDSCAFDLGLQSFGHRTQHEAAAAVPQHVVDLLEAVEADDQQRYFARRHLRGGNHRSQCGLKGVAVGEPGERIVFR